MSSTSIKDDNKLNLESSLEAAMSYDEKSFTLESLEKKTNVNESIVSSYIIFFSMILFFSQIFIQIMKY